MQIYIYNKWNENKKARIQSCLLQQKKFLKFYVVNVLQYTQKRKRRKVSHMIMKINN
jgi:hypothetical protein